MNTYNKKQLLDIAILAAIEAGQAIMSVYCTNFEVDYKDDQSPLTIADTKANEIIIGYLAETSLPVLSEESRQIPYTERKDWQQFWLVDPLDGTKEFIKRNDEFTVNIALIEEQAPALGVVYAPAIDTLYFGDTADTGYKVDGRTSDQWLIPAENRIDLDSLLACSIQLPMPGKGRLSVDEITIVGSRSHGGPDLEEHVNKARKKYRQVHFKPAGSSLKICMVAEGSADQYPRLGPTMEWDTAAANAVANAAGATIKQYASNQDLLYNKEDLLNPWFIVSGPNI